MRAEHQSESSSPEDETADPDVSKKLTVWEYAQQSWLNFSKEYARASNSDETYFRDLLKKFTFWQYVRLVLLHLPIGVVALYPLYEATLIASYWAVSKGAGGAFGRSHYRADRSIEQLMEQAELYRQAKGTLPNSLHDLCPPPVLPGRQRNWNNLPEYTIAEYNALDPWDVPFKYEIQNDKPIISTYGADGQPGGVGLDADRSTHMLSQPRQPLPFSQYRNNWSEVHYHDMDIYILIPAVPMLMGIILLIPLAIEAASRPPSFGIVILQFAGPTLLFVMGVGALVLVGLIVYWMITGAVHLFGLA